jgi:hypothetical protein
MSTSRQFRTILPDIDPTIAVAQAVRADEQLRGHYHRKGKRGDPKISFTAALLFVAFVIASTALNESPHEATARMERVAAKAEAVQRIAPETRVAMLKLLATRHYDCDQVKCDEQLQVRNRLARQRISKAIFGASFASDATGHDGTGAR